MVVERSEAGRWGGVGRRVKDHDLGHCVMGRDWGDVTCVKKLGLRMLPHAGNTRVILCRDRRGKTALLI